MNSGNKQQNTRWSEYDIYDNTAREVIAVHRDTLDNKLRDFESSIENKRLIRHSTELILSLLGILLTSNFKDFLGIPGNVWFAVFFLAFVMAILRLFWETVIRRKGITREDILNELMAKTKKLESGISDTQNMKAPFLIQEEGKNEVYLVENGIKRHIPDPETFSKLGYAWDEIHKVTTDEALKYTTGDVLPRQK